MIIADPDCPGLVQCLRVATPFRHSVSVGPLASYSSRTRVNAPMEKKCETETLTPCAIDRRNI